MLLNWICCVDAELNFHLVGGVYEIEMKFFLFCQSLSLVCSDFPGSDGEFG